MGHYEKAESVYLQALNIKKEVLGEKHPNYIESLNDLAQLYEETNRPKLAWEKVQQAIEANTNYTISQTIDAETTAKLAEVDYVSFDGIGNSLGVIYKILAQENRKTEQTYINDLALKLLKQDKNQLTSEAGKLRVLEESHKWILQSMQVLDKEKDAAKIFSMMEQNKSVLLLDAASTKRAHIAGLLPDSLIQKEKELEKKFTETKAALAQKRPKTERDNIRTALNQLNLQIDQFQQTIKQDYPKYASLKYMREAIDVNAIQATLDEKTALLEYLAGDTVVYMVCVTKEQVKIHELELDNQELKRRVKSLHQALSDYQQLIKNQDVAYVNYTRQAHWFYKNLVAPAFSADQDIEELVIVSDAELGHLPFEAFLVEQAPQTTTAYEQLHYLIKDYKISYNYSAALWKENKESVHKKHNGQILGVAANYKITLDSSKLDWRLPIDKRRREFLIPLPAARNEVETLQKHYQGSYVFDGLASESFFKEEASEFGVIHLAMHGLLNKKEQALSCLAFTEISDSAENNFLHAYEISKMDLSADLVILSACETGFGKFERGNGIASLARSFMYAGVPSLIVSLWQVNDQATSRIMQNLYQKLSDGLPVHEALRQAKLDYIQSAKGITAHPAFWSPFIHIGNTQAIAIQEKGNWLPWLIGSGMLIVVVLGGFVWRRRTAA